MSSRNEKNFVSKKLSAFVHFCRETWQEVKESGTPEGRKRLEQQQRELATFRKFFGDIPKLMAEETIENNRLIVEIMKQVIAGKLRLSDKAMQNIFNYTYKDTFASSFPSPQRPENRRLVEQESRVK